MAGRRAYRDHIAPARGLLGAVSEPRRGCRKEDTLRKLSLSLVLAFSALVVASPAVAHDVPNTAAWHTHDGLGAGAHHKGTVFFPALFTAAGLGVYGSPASGGYLDCPNATDKGLLPSFGTSSTTIHAVGVCMNELYIIHLMSGPSAPADWASVTFTNGFTYHYKVTPRG